MTRERVEVARLRLPVKFETTIAIGYALLDEHGDGVATAGEKIDGVEWLVFTVEVDE